jgi:hypothetical protein
MKNARKITAAQEILAQAQKLGFQDAYLVFCDEEGNLFESIDDAANDNLNSDDDMTVSVELVLDEELTFRVEADEEGESTQIVFP